MARFLVRVERVVGTNPDTYAFFVYKNEQVEVAEINVANISAALDGVKAAISANLAGEDVRKVDMVILSQTYT